jgi:hypothetical protein
MDPLSAIVLGIAMSWIGAAIDQNQKEKEAAKQKEEEARLLQAKKDTYQKEYEFAKQEALKSANTAEKETTLAESILGDSYNNNLKGFALQQQAQAIERENSSISADSSVANAETSLGMSGLRGSSTQENIARQEEYNKDIQLFQHQQNELSNELTLANAFTGLNQSINSIQNQRIQIDDLRKSYEEGGRNKVMFDQEMANLDLSHEINMDRLDRSIKTDINDVFSTIASGFNMATGLQNFGQNLNLFNQNWGNPNLGSIASTGVNLPKALTNFKWN